jgi:hypothetical protein
MCVQEERSRGCAGNINRRASSGFHGTTIRSDRELFGCGENARRTEDLGEQ